MGLLSPILWIPSGFGLAMLTYAGIEKPTTTFARLLTAHPRHHTLAAHPNTNTIDNSQNINGA
jgi:peptidoglycan/LPS O-acetylase OafA/YrhL